LISVIILSHNAFSYTKRTLIQLKQTFGVSVEVIVLDNNSTFETRQNLLAMKDQSYIDKLMFERRNTLFARGNNLAFEQSCPDSQYILLLNSDVEIRDKNWLLKLLSIHARGATALGVCENNPITRGDGFCFLIDRDLYAKYRLDEEFEWWWSVTKLQAQLLIDGYTVSAVRNYADLLYHYGGQSGTEWKKAKGMYVDREKIKKWFPKNNHVLVIDKL
jgi:glycosyltransferase involved in cell wall biosynthesis